jgi:hypothetical protein
MNQNGSWVAFLVLSLLMATGWQAVGSEFPITASEKKLVSFWREIGFGQYFQWNRGPWAVRLAASACR